MELQNKTVIKLGYFLKVLKLAQFKLPNKQGGQVNTEKGLNVYVE